MDLIRIPGVGKETKKDLLSLGYYKVEDLVGEDPDAMYERQCQIEKCQVDRCVLYVYRCAVAFAKDPTRNDLRWWNFKD